MITDFHSHILPGIDDGSSCVEESIAMLKKQAQQGITHVVATPHFYANYQSTEEFLEKRNRAEAKLREEMKNHPGLPTLSVGAEVYFFKGISQSTALEVLTIDQKNYIIIEMLGSPWTESAYRELEDIYSGQGLTPIVAHVDRYLGFWQDYGIPKRLSQLPVLVQANASFFTNRFTVAKACRELKRGRIHLLGSDCHNLTTRPPNLDLAIASIVNRVGEEPIRQIKANEQLVLDL